MKVSIDYVKNNEQVKFEDIKDKECFFSGGVLYMKIFEQDLNEYNIKNVNAISIINAGLTFFYDDEIVYKANKEIKKVRS